MSDEQYEAGMGVRREVLGDAHVDRAVAGTTEFTAAFQDFITRYAWGEIWTWPGLDERARRVLVLGTGTAVGSHCSESTCGALTGTVKGNDITFSFTADFQDFITRYAWGDVWTRDGLDRRTRSCVTLAVLAALHCDDELAMHVRAARRNGLTPDEIGEVLLHTAVYAGLPAANTAFKVAQRALADDE